MSDNLLSLKHVSKEYSGNKVLKDINIELKKGEIHALIGENGAGKSTLMNILFGMSVIHTTGGFEGTIEIDGKEADIKSPHDAMAYGIGMVHQEFMLVPGFTIMENIKLNREITKPNLVSPVFGKRLETLDIKQMNMDTRQALDTLDLNIEEYVQVAGLPVGHMQFIEIAREIDKTGLKILVFDEPTAVLAESEAANLLKAMKKLAQKGIGILFISHRLDEIIDVADVVTVLRDGEHVVTKNVEDTNKYEIAQLMVGRSITIDREEGTNKNIVDETILDIKDLHVAMPGERVKGVNLNVKKGEIVGIGGLAGQGKLGIANGIMGIFPAKGEVKFKGKKSALNDPKSAIKSGLAFVSEDRKGVGLLLDESIESNIAFSAMQINNEFLRNSGMIKLKDSKKIRDHANKMIKDLDIRCTSSMQRVGSLSGGNQQKVCVARALTLSPELLLVSEPTRGIDVGAKYEIYTLMNRLVEDGMSIIMISSELPEILGMSDRIYVVSDGRITGELPAEGATQEKIMEMATN